jgi:hopene-associated glycosyltransferase HpnB
MSSPNTHKPGRKRLLVQAAPWVPAAAWAYLSVARGRFWSTTTRLPSPRPPAPGQWPSVAVIIPARDEAALLPHTLPSVLAQEYPGRARVVLVDDQSTDGTSTLARSLAAQGRGRGLGLSIIEGEPRPPGWAGKPWAMAQGVKHALAAPERPQWLLFTDADIHHPPRSVQDLVAAALAGQRTCLSVMARLSAGTGWERLLMPAFVYFFSQIYPFSWVNDQSRRTAAAAGGCMLVEIEALQKAGGIDAIAGATIDDVALAKALKGTGANIWLGLAGEPNKAGTAPAQAAPQVESRRSYPTLSGIWEMVARNAYTQLGHSPAALAGTVVALSSIYLAPPVLTLAGLATRRPSMAVAGLSAWTAMTATYLPIVRYYQAPPVAAVALPFTASVYLAMTLSSARRHRAGGVPWKGRAGASRAR